MRDERDYVPVLEREGWRRGNPDMVVAIVEKNTRGNKKLYVPPSLSGPRALAQCSSSGTAAVGRLDSIA